MNCKNYEKNGLTALIFWVFMFLSAYFGRLLNMGFMALFLVLFFGGVALKYSITYVMCLREANNKFLPPKRKIK